MLTYAFNNFVDDTRHLMILPLYLFQFLFHYSFYSYNNCFKKHNWSLLPWFQFVKKIHFLCFAFLCSDHLRSLAKYTPTLLRYNVFELTILKKKIFQKTHNFPSLKKWQPWFWWNHRLDHCSITYYRQQKVCRKVGKRCSHLKKQSPRKLTLLAH